MIILSGTTMGFGPKAHDELRRYFGDPILAWYFISWSQRDVQIKDIYPSSVFAWFIQIDRLKTRQTFSSQVVDYSIYI